MSVQFVKQFFTYRFDACCENISKGARNVLVDQSRVLEELLAQQTSAMLLLNNTIELGEKLYPSTSVQGRGLINAQLQELQQSLEALFDSINSTERNLKSKLNQYAILFI